MPITPAYKWHENDGEVTVEVALRNTSRGQADIVSTECFLKVNSTPYLLQVDLFGEVDAKRSTAVVSESGVTFTLYKTEKGLWGRLTAVGDKQEVLARRQKSLETNREAAGKLKEDARLLKERTNKLALEKQWALEEAKKKILDGRKAEELRRAQEELLQWQKQTAESDPKGGDSATKGWGSTEHETGSNGAVALDGVDEGECLSDGEDPFIPANQGRAAIVEVEDSDGEEEGPARKASGYGPKDNGQLKAGQNGSVETVVIQATNPGFSNLLTNEVNQEENEAQLVARSSRKLSSEPAPDSASKKLSEPLENVQKSPGSADKENAVQGRQDGLELVKGGKVAEVIPAAVLPPLRRRMVVPVQFTAKELRPNVPARESRFKEIELKKAQSAAADEDAADISERQPAFLKDKGDGFYRAGNFEGAISAYSRAINKDPSAALCYSNRGACHLRLGRLDECLSDCTTAVDLLERQLAECEEETDGRDMAGKDSDGHKLWGLHGSVGRQVDGQVLLGDDVGGQELRMADLPSGDAEPVPDKSVQDSEKEDGSEADEGDKVAQNSSESVAVSEERGSRERETENGKPSVEGSAPSVVNRGLGCKLAEKENRGKEILSERERILTALVKALIRRAAVQCEKGLYSEAISDYEKALRSEPRNKGIQKDLQAVRDYLKPPVQSEWKSRGNNLYREGDLQGAVEAYTRAVDCEVQDSMVTRACISNRSACFIQLGKFPEAEADCSQALELLGYETPNVGSVEGGSGVPDNKQAVLKLLSRRGMVYGHLKKYDDAICDLTTAERLAVDLGNAELAKNLERDIKYLRSLRDPAE